MKSRFKGPAGAGVVEVPDDATVGQLVAAIQTQAGLDSFTLKYGWPMKTLDLASQRDISARSLGLSGETFTIVPTETTTPRQAEVAATPPPRSSPSASAPVAPQRPSKRHAAESPEDIAVPWPEQSGTLLLRVMPSDNSCLFTAFGGAVSSDLQAPQLRKLVAEYIMEHPETYTEAVLGMPPSKYCRDIQGKDYWGGGIEIEIFANMFDIEVCAFDVQAKTLMSFGQGKSNFCILVYSGIHFDRVALSPSEHPYASSTLPAELDKTVWEVTEKSAVIKKAEELIDALNRIHYYTDPNAALLRCEAPDCDWLGSGQQEANEHAKVTGHVNMTEVEDNVLVKCNAPGCDWLGTGDKEASKHRNDTGHTSWSVIPDF